MTEQMGHVTVELMARVGNGEPQSLGFVHMPLTVSAIATGTLEGNIRAALDYVREDLKAVFGQDA